MELSEVRSLLEALVRHESPSTDPEAVARVQAHYAEALGRLGAEVSMVRSGGSPQGPATLVARVTGQSQAPMGGKEPAPLLVVGHLDTVHPVGTLEGPLPLKAEDGRLYGPGVYDMKAGLAVLAGALGRLRDRGLAPGCPLVILVTPDEEVGAPTSRALLESHARAARGALVLEPPLPGGNPKIRRKGVGELRFTVHGVPAHSGIEPERGASAIHALGELLPELLALANPAAGTTLNVGTIGGGSAVNVVAARASLVVDVRVATMDEAHRIENAVRNLRVSDSRIRLEIAGGVDRPPMESSPASLALLDLARQVALELGRDSFEGGGTGGGSDGNFLSAVGCPVLDGLGVEGDGAHTHEEHVVLADLEWRIQFLTALLPRLGASPGSPEPTPAS